LQAVRKSPKWTLARQLAPAESTVSATSQCGDAWEKRPRSLAKSSRTSANRILVELIESGIEAGEQEKKRFLDLADRLASTSDPEEQSRLKKELARMTFGD
jgi:hypothetical protein